jgi:hypothetical protein
MSAERDAEHHALVRNVSDDSADLAAHVAGAGHTEWASFCGRRDTGPRRKGSGMEVDRGQLDRVQIWLTSLEEPMVVSWETREQILGRLTPTQAAVGAAFRHVGVSDPVMLSSAEKRQLLVLIDGWREDVGVAQIPDGVVDLRSGLIDDLRAAGHGP